MVCDVGFNEGWGQVDYDIEGLRRGIRPRATTGQGGNLSHVFVRFGGFGWAIHHNLELVPSLMTAHIFLSSRLTQARMACFP